MTDPCSCGYQETPNAHAHRPKRHYVGSHIHANTGHPLQQTSTPRGKTLRECIYPYILTNKKSTENEISREKVAI
jgi:hypothetical protein